MIASTHNDELLNPRLYADDRERMRHLGVIHSIASEVDHPIREVVLLYEEIFEHMRARAYVTDYLPVLVAKKVVERFRSLH